MTQPTLEQRVAALERQVAQLQGQDGNGKPEKPWLTTMGAFSGDEGMKEIFEEALKFREKDRERARRRYAKKSPSRRAKK